MGWFDFLKNTANKEVSEVKFSAPVTGKYIPLNEISDEVFSQGILGDGCGVIPSDRKVYAPVDGKISMIADTKHAIGIAVNPGVELLIHVGMDTVEMNGDGFEVYVSNGQKVKRGDLLLEFDMEKIKTAGYPTDTAFIVVEKGEFKDLSLRENCNFVSGESIGKLRR